MIKLPKKLLALTAFVICLGAAQPVLANEHEGYSKEEMQKMSPEEKEAFRAKKEAEWKEMSKEEKIKTIEKRRAERLEKMDEKWSKMTDDEKIKFVEERHERKMERREEMKGHKKRDSE